LTSRELKRFIIGGAQQIVPDSQGRFVLADSLKTFANIEEAVVFVGVGEWIEIWDQSKWGVYLKEIASSSAQIANNMYSEKLGNK
jgi:MraZ protein